MIFEIGLRFPFLLYLKKKMVNTVTFGYDITYIINSFVLY